MSTRPNLSTAALTILSQFSSELGRNAMISVLAPSFSHSVATFFSSSALLAARTTLAPAPANVFAASAPKAPEAPAIIAVLPLISNKDSGFLRNDSAINSSRFCRGVPKGPSLWRVCYRDDDRAHLIAAIPIPGEISKGAPLSRDLVDVATDIFDSHDAVLEEDPMDGLPFGEIILPVAASRPLAVFLRQMRMQGAITLWADCGGERVIVRLRVVADHLDLLLHKPFAGGRHEAGCATEIIFTVFVELVPAGIDDHDVARTYNFPASLLQVIAGDGLPFVLRQRHHDAGAEEMRQRHFIDKRRALNDVGRCIDMGGVMHRGRDAL